MTRLDDEWGNAGTSSLAPFFLERGYGAVELEYRRRDHEGGGWPGTNQDILQGIRRIVQLHREGSAPGLHKIDPALRRACQALRPERLIVIGHSAGGCLALWAAHQLHRRHSLDTNLPESSIVVAAAPVADLVLGHSMRVSDEGDAVDLYMKGSPEELAHAYSEASPAALLPVTFPLLVMYGDKDSDVPPKLMDSYAETAVNTAPGLAQQLVIPGADHFDVVNATSSAWVDSIVPALAGIVRQSFGSLAADALVQSASRYDRSGHVHIDCLLFTAIISSGLWRLTHLN